MRKALLIIICTLVFGVTSMAGPSTEGEFRRRIASLESQVFALNNLTTSLASSKTKTQVQVVSGTPASTVQGGSGSSSSTGTAATSANAVVAAAQSSQTLGALATQSAVQLGTNVQNAGGTVLANADVMNSYINAFPAGMLILAYDPFYVDVSASAVTLSDDSGDNVTLLNLVSIGGTSANLDTGSWAANTIYCVYLIYDSSTKTTEVLFSLNYPAPTLPSGYTYYRMVGIILTSATTPSVYQSIQSGNQWFLTVPVLLTSTKSTTYTALTIPEPPGNICSSTLLFAEWLITSGGTAGFLCISLNGTDVWWQAAAFPSASHATGQVTIPLLAGWNVEYKVPNNGTFGIYLEGFTFNL